MRPNVEIAKEAGLEVGRGIMVSHTCETSKKGIFAAGDCTESLDITTDTPKILALIPNAYMQGEVAGITMAGGAKTYENAIPMNAIGFFGLHMITAGSYEGEEVITETKEHYRKLIFKDGVLKGFILIGDVKRAGIYTSIIKEQIPISEVDIALLKEKPQMMLFNKSRRIQTLGGINPKLGGVKVGS